MTASDDGEAKVLLETARSALRGELSVPAAGATRAAALLTRTALDRILDERLARLDPQLTHCSARVRLICWETLIDRDQGARAAWAYAGLSRACHHHAYELTPRTAEIEHLIDAVESLI